MIGELKGPLIFRNVRDGGSEFIGKVNADSRLRIVRVGGRKSID